MEGLGNTTNSHMNNQPYTVGVLPVPDRHYEPVLYSHQQATKNFNKICEDIYIKQSKSKKTEKTTPKSVVCLSGAALLYGIYKMGKVLLKK